MRPIGLDQGLRLGTTACVLQLGDQRVGRVEVVEKLKAAPRAGPVPPPVPVAPVPLVQVQEAAPLPVSLQVQLPLDEVAALPVAGAAAKPQVRITVAVAELDVPPVPGPGNVGKVRASALATGRMRTMHTAMRRALTGLLDHVLVNS